MTLTTGKDWFGIPVTDPLAHLADYVRCLLKEGLRWSANRKFAQKFSSFRRGNCRDTSAAPRAPSTDIIDIHTLHELSKGGNADRFQDSTATACHGRAVFETQMGMVGVRSRITEAGDKVCVLYGVDLPLIPRGEGDEGYSVVGSCYVPPLMKGEAVLELPRSGSPLEETWVELV